MNNAIHNFINEHTANSTLFVLKGYAVEECGVERTSIAHVIENKVSRLLWLTQQVQQIISYEEFICLYSMLIIQYRKIYILENPVYHTMYPVNVQIDKEVHYALLHHFDEDADENTEEDESVEDLSEYTEIYGKYLETEAGIACCYNLDDSKLSHEKIERESFAPRPCSLSWTQEQVDGIVRVNLCNAVDYYELVGGLESSNSCYSVIWENFDLGKDAMRQQLEVLNASFPGRLSATPVGKAIKTKKYPEAFDLLKRYWGNESRFRDFSVYNIEAVRRGEKKIQSVSQERVVSDLIEQAEHCIHGEAFRDIFVTAPTGSGKSMMFQLPAMYLAEKCGLVTIVITPLIGLMKDQVQALEQRGYLAASTINSDTSPIIRQEILDGVIEKKFHILYLSPESLLSKSDVEQLIGTRRIGMIVVDEAHIVTTWGKQFRPDYWFLGDHVRKIRRTQQKRETDPCSFIIATFTATAIYEGKEDMYHETLNSLHMIDPITYLGCVRRNDIVIDVCEVEKKSKAEYEINKFDSLISFMISAIAHNQKMLIYFPTVSLINRFYEYCYSKDLSAYVAIYHGQLRPDIKDENFNAFYNGEKLIMAATKAFGMGIDISDISIVSHFAPTGNVCDYMQEIGRAARKPEINGLAVYRHMSNDFQHINRLHGLSAIRLYQLVEVIKKVLEIYISTRYQNSKKASRKKNQMLVDAESFAYIFGNSASSDDDLINKVKTAMLLIQKDYENRGFPPFHMRPIPLFRSGFFAISFQEQQQLHQRYHGAVQLVFPKMNVCKVDLNKIWEQDYDHEMSFPQFKFLLYSHSEKLDFNQKWNLTNAMSIDISLEDNATDTYERIINAIKKSVDDSIITGNYLPLGSSGKTVGLVEQLRNRASISQYRAENIVNVFLAAMDIYQKENYGRRMSSKLYQMRSTKSRNMFFQFSVTTRDFFRWIDRQRKYVLDNMLEREPGETVQKLYIVNEPRAKCKEITTILGILEAMGTLRFRSLGGSNSQIYIYVNETKTMQMVRDRPEMYRNKLLELINSRHSESVRMMTYLFQNNLSSEQIWDHLENYFLGILPEDLRDKKSSKISKTQP